VGILASPTNALTGNLPEKYLIKKQLKLGVAIKRHMEADSSTELSNSAFESAIQGVKL
jgi:hypothetical protein